jgi:PDZ domain
VTFAFWSRMRVPIKRASFAVLAPASMLVVLIALGRTADAESSIDFCNVGNTTLSMVTIGDDPRGGWAVDGWQTIEPGDCRRVDAIFHLKVGFAIVKASGQRGMQVYDQTSIPRMTHIGSNYCVHPAKNFHRRHDTLRGLTECQPGEAMARFALDLKAMHGKTLTVQIPADEHRDIIPFQQPASATHSFPPFKPNERLWPPNAGFVSAMRGLAEQQERLRFRIEQQDLSPITDWRAFYVRDLGIVARPVTHAISVVRDSPADKAGIRRGDEILEIDEIDVQSAWHARSLLVRTRPGENHAITFVQNGALRKAEMRLDALPANLALIELHPKQGWLGVEFESAARVEGVIYQVGTPHLELGDDILKIGRSDFDGVDGLARWLASDVDATTVELQVRCRATGKIIVMILDKLN